VATLLVDKRDQMFVLKEMLDIDALCRFPKFSTHSVYPMVLTEAHKFANAELHPATAEADRQGCDYDPKTRAVRFPDCFKTPYRKFLEGGWLAMCDSPEVGGDGFPVTVGTAISELFYAGCFYLYGAAELTHAAAKVIETFGTDEQKRTYMERLFSGEWMGTMCLTEPQAGSDVGAVQTVAAPNDDGSYSISGTKIFITAGEHDLTENIIHMVLARIEGDPPGTRGLSLFIVPKFLPGADGKPGERNDVYCTGIEHKMGLHGLVTCTMAFGDGSSCRGYLLGERGKGMPEMFHMMNEQRLLVGVEGLSFSSNAFLHAVDYTQNRFQGASVYSGRDRSVTVAVIDHPDIKRMLLTMKAYVEGCRALAYFTSCCIDHAGVTEGEESARWHGLVELLTPVVKAYLTDKAWDITALAMQCAGGYGYCSDYPFERLARDCKVTTIFEGTNGIQAMDLMFRKLLGNKLENFGTLMEKMEKTIDEASRIKGIAEYATTVRQAKEGLESVVEDLTILAGTEQGIDIYAKTAPLLDLMGDVILAWLHLWQLSVAYPKMMEALGGRKEKSEIEAVLGKNKNASFYYGKVMGSRFYIGTLLKTTFGKMERLKSDEEPVMEMFEKSFVA